MENGNISSERLKKAIERNRLKRLKKQGLSRDIPAEGRVSVGKPDTIEFTTDIDRTVVQSPVQVSYGTGATVGDPKPLVRARKTRAVTKKKPVRRKRVKTRSQGADKLERYGVWAGCLFCLFLVLRLVFAERGALDFVQRQSYLEGRVEYLQELEEEQLALHKRIDLVRNNRSYQRKQVRDRLGFIAKDEYLVLFSKQSKVGSI